MAANGVISPERITQGSAMIKAVISACCALRASTETIIPPPTTAKANKIAVRHNNRKDPRRGISK